MTIYTKNSMVKAKHIKEIDRQLKALDSKVDEKFLKYEYDHLLGNVLSLACGCGTYGISQEQISSLRNQEFEIDYLCEHSI